VRLKRRKSEASVPPAIVERWKLSGDDDPEIVAGGQSNVACLVTAHDAGLGPQNMRAAIAYAADFGRVDDDYWGFLADAGAGRTVALVWDGNQHNGAFLVQPDPPFRVYRSAADAGAPAEQAGAWVPREMLSSYWAGSFAALGEALDLLVKRSRVLVIATPPPKPGEYLEPKFQGKLEWDPWVADIASARRLASNELAVSSEPLRLALWSIIQDGMREEARRSGATYVPVPDSAFDPAGLLAPAYSAGDLTHANSEYGGLMWAQIEAVLQPRPER
jgi:hypothetical protein